MHESRRKVHRGAHLALVAPPERAPPMTHAEPKGYLTTTRCRPSELPGTVSLTLEPEAMSLARARSRESGIELSAWVRLAVECARQAARAAGLFGLSVADVHAVVDEASAESPRTEPVVAAPLAAYVRALCAGTAAESPARPPATELLVPAPDELAVAWSAAAADAGQPLDAWASLQVLAAPTGVVAWEAAAARRGFYLSEWVLAVSASSSARRSSARPQV